jgi:hypothetical protein
MSDGAERRCPSCGALVAADAEWCGQCFAPLTPARVEPDPSTVPAIAEGGAVEAPETAPVAAPPEAAFWPCSVCGTRNRIEADTCETCGTPFALVMQSVTTREPVDPHDALMRSLIFPGLGHRMVGRATDGAVRGGVFAVSLAAALIAGLSGVRSAAMLVIVVAFLAIAVAVYVVSALEASQLARGGDLIVSSRTILWVLVGAIFLSVAVAGFAVVSAARG